MNDIEIAKAVATLDSTIEDLRVRVSGAERYSSVFGAFVVLPKPTGHALELASQIRKMCAKGHVRLSIGVSDGRLEAVTDVNQVNVVGTAINYAARLAFLEGGEGRIAVNEFTADQAIRT